MIGNTTLTFNSSEKMAHFLMLNASEMPDLGILEGRMKAILFFFNAAKSNSSDIFRDYAIELLEELYEILSTTEVSPDFKSGLCGIGWATEYLLVNKYLSAEGDICKDFDEKIKNYFYTQQYSGLSLSNGILGILLYLISRLESQNIKANKQRSLFYETFITDVLDKIQNSVEEITFILKEEENDNFDNQMLIIYSKWEFPLLLWSIGKCIANDISKNSAISILIYLLNCLEDDNLPVMPVNINLLLFVLNSLYDLNIPEISTMADNKIELLKTNINHKTTDLTDKTSNILFKFDV